jgi:hypothetical protein
MGQLVPLYVEAMTKAFKAAVPKEPPPRPGWGSSVDPGKKRVKPPLPRSNASKPQRSEAEKAAAKRVVGLYTLKSVDP